MIYRTGHRPHRQTVPAVYMRGGSSKALFFHEADIPAAGPERDALLKRVMGTPDPLQIDGMGGAKAVTSKVAIIRPSTREDADVDYTFAQVSVNVDSVGYTANCGNISAGVGPFAIEEGLVKDFREGESVDEKIRTQVVRVYNTNTDKVLVAHVPIDEEGAPVEKGDFAMAAVPGTGAPILMDYAGTIGAKFQRGVLPTGHAVDTIEFEGRNIELTVGDAGNPVIFFNAQDVGMTGYETAAQLTSDKALEDRINEVRGKAAMLLGMCDDWKKVDEQSPFIPLPVAVAPPKENDAHISGRLFLDHMCHESMAASGATCMAACSRTVGTVVNKILKPELVHEDTLRISHPLGIMPVFVKTKPKSISELGIPEFETLSFIRTARRIMEGNLLLPVGWTPTP